MSRIKRAPIHPFVFAIFPILSLAIHNEEQSPLQEALLAIVVSLVFTILIWFCIKLLIKHIRKSAIVTSIFLILFFSYGQFLTAIRYLAYLMGVLSSAELFVESTPALIFWSLLWAVLFAAAVFLLVKSSSELHPLNQFLNVFSLTLLLIVLVNWSQGYVANEKAYQYADKWRQNISSNPPEIRIQADYQPNIYYIVLDGYAREDILKAIYHFDNSLFYSFLADKGFYIANESHSNYMQTPLSFASSLNFTYLDDVASEIGTHSSSRMPLISMVSDNKVFRELRAHGYKVVTFSSGVPFTDLKDSDTHLAPPGNLNAFENTLIDTTPLPLLLRLPFLKTQYTLHRDRILYAFDHLADTIGFQAPIFVFIHILAPHPPFVFRANGEAVNPDRRFDYFDGSQFTSIASEQEYIENYGGQLAFVTGKLETCVSEILSQSSDPPIIILQSDHGPGAMLDWTSDQNSNIPERMSILNAYYFPDQDYRDLYPSITPVNTFRIILNHLEGTNYEHLQDRSFFSTLANPYSFIDVSDRLTAGDHN